MSTTAVLTAFASASVPCFYVLAVMHARNKPVYTRKHHAFFLAAGLHSSWPMIHLITQARCSSRCCTWSCTTPSPSQGLLSGRCTLSPQPSCTAAQALPTYWPRCVNTQYIFQQWTTLTLNVVVCTGWNWCLVTAAPCTLHQHCLPIAVVRLLCATPLMVLYPLLTVSGQCRRA